MNFSSRPTTPSPRRVRPLALAVALVAVLAAPLAFAQQARAEDLARVGDGQPGPAPPRGRTAHTDGA